MKQTFFNAEKTFKARILLVKWSLDEVACIKTGAAE